MYNHQTAIFFDVQVEFAPSLEQCSDNQSLVVDFVSFTENHVWVMTGVLAKTGVSGN
jgi:hypothetical protein